MGAAEKSWAARAQKLAIYCIQVAVKKKKKKQQPLAGPKCPIKYMWHLKGWMGSVHLSVDESCARSLLSNHFVVTFLRRGASLFWAALPNGPRCLDPRWNLVSLPQTHKKGDKTSLPKFCGCDQAFSPAPQSQSWKDEPRDIWPGGTTFYQLWKSTSVHVLSEPVSMLSK